MLRRGDYLTIGRFADFLGDDAVSTVLHRIEGEEPLLHIAYHTESKTRLDHLVWQSYNDSGGSIAEFLQGGVMASAEKIGTVPLVCAAVVLSVFAWILANSPVDTGKRVSGKVLQCENRRRSCVVQLGDSGPLMLMAMPQGAVGQTLVIGVSRLRFTGRAYYWQAH